MKRISALFVITCFYTIAHAQTDSAAVRADRICSMLNLGVEKQYKIYWMNKQYDTELSKVPSQFKDSTGRAQAVQRLEKVRNDYFKTLMNPSQYNRYILNKAVLLK